MARYVDSGYGTPYVRTATPPTYVDSGYGTPYVRTATPPTYVDSGYGTPHVRATTPPTSVDSGYRTSYVRSSTPPTYNGYDRSSGSYSAKGGVVGDAWRVPQAPVANNYQRDEFGEYIKKSHSSPAATPGYASSGQSYRPSEYGNPSSNKDRWKSGGDNYRGERDEFNYRKETTVMVPTGTDGYVASRPSHGTGSLTMPINDIGAAIELLNETAATHSTALGSYPHQHQAGSRYTESVSTVYYYPEIMPPTMDPTKRYGNINLGSRRPAAAEIGRNYY